MAKKKDDFSFNFSNKKIESKQADPAPEVTAEPAAEADPFASTETPATDPFAADPFASTETPAEDADPFASTETPAAEADPFASTETPADPFAETPAEEPAADPFAETPAAEPAAESPAEETLTEAAEEEAPKAAKKATGPVVKEHKQFKILVLADFTGRTNRSVCKVDDISMRKVRVVEADTLDKTIAAMKPSIALGVDEKTVMPLSFKAMEDFRPDSILQQVEAFQGMLNLRTQLKDAKKFKEAAGAVRKLMGMKPAKKATPAASAKAGHEAESDFERLINQPGAAVAPKGAGEANVDALIANLVGGYSVPDADPEQATMVKLVEDALSAGLRAVLRHPAFQGLEGAWRGVEFLVSRLNTDEDLKICVFDISKEELYADLSGPPVIQKTGMYQILVEQTQSAGAEPFAMVVGDYEFDQSPQSIALMAKVATLMHEAQIPFVAAGEAKMMGFASYVKAPDSGKWNPPTDLGHWDKLRAHKLACYLGLTGPRFLLRMPYGPKTDAIETYPFNEMPESPLPEQYLWANGAYAVALLIGQSFLENGWDGIEPENDVSELPCHMAVVDGDKEMTPCAEGWLSDRVGDILHQSGLIPLLSVRNSASVKVAGIHSIAKGKALAAYWAKG